MSFGGEIEFKSNQTKPNQTETEGLRNQADIRSDIGTYMYITDITCIPVHTPYYILHTYSTVLKIENIDYPYPSHSSSIISIKAWKIKRK